MWSTGDEGREGGGGTQQVVCYKAEDATWGIGFRGEERKM